MWLSALCKHLLCVCFYVHIHRHTHIRTYIRKCLYKSVCVHICVCKYFTLGVRYLGRVCVLYLTSVSQVFFFVCLFYIIQMLSSPKSLSAALNKALQRFMSIAWTRLRKGSSAFRVDSYSWSLFSKIFSAFKHKHTIVWRDYIMNMNNPQKGFGPLPPHAQCKENSIHKSLTVTVNKRTNGLNMLYLLYTHFPKLSQY